MIDAGLHLVPDGVLSLSSGIVQPLDKALPDSNTRIVAISESDLAIILALLSETQARYLPVSAVVATSSAGTWLLPSQIGKEYTVGEIVPGIWNQFPLTIRYVGLPENMPDDIVGIIGAMPEWNDMLSQRIAIAREHIMVDLTALLTTINASLALIEEHAERQADAQERIATAVETQASGEGLDAIAENIGLLLPLVAAI